MKRVDNSIKMIINTPQQFLNAIMISQDAFFEKAEIYVENQNSSFSQPFRIVDDIKYGIISTISRNNGRFTNAQLSSYILSMRVDPFGKYCIVGITTNYFNNEKELNDFLCVTAELGEILHEKAKKCKDDYEKLKVFSNWINKNFKYQNTNNIADHSVVNLLRTRKGVCQAIAALAVKVLPYLGISTLYISGEGKDMVSWGAHAWNLVKIDGRWIHIDFTFSMNSFLLSTTKSEFEKHLFETSHKWNTKDYDSKVLDLKWKQVRKQGENIVQMVMGSKKCIINGVTILCENPLYTVSNGKSVVDLHKILRLSGGACEFIFDTDIINICIGHKRTTIKDASLYFEDGYFDRRILSKFCEKILCEESVLAFHI